MSEFRKHIASLIKRYGTARAVAELIPMSESAFSRGVRNEGTLSEENLLRLAEATGEDLLYVLRVAGKGTVADIIERNFGQPQRALTREDRILIGLDLQSKQQLVRLVKNLSTK